MIVYNVTIYYLSPYYSCYLSKFFYDNKMVYWGTCFWLIYMISSMYLLLVRFIFVVRCLMSVKNKVCLSIIYRSRVVCLLEIANYYCYCHSVIFYLLQILFFIIYDFGKINLCFNVCITNTLFGRKNNKFIVWWYIKYL